MMHQKKAHGPRRKMTLLSVLLVFWFLDACGNPVPAPASPPQPGKVLYALYMLWEKPVHSLKDLATTPAALIAEAMRSSDGQKIWQTSLLTGADTDALQLQNAAIISAGATIFVTVSTPQPGGKNAQVLALDAQSGHLRWKTALDGAHIVRAVAGSGNLYVEVGGRVEALAGTSGNHLWSASPDAGYQPGALVPSGDAVYVEEEADFLPASGGNTYDSAILRALRARDGTELWRREVANTITDGWSSLVQVDMQADARTVYVLSEGQVLESHGNVFGPYPRYTLFALSARDGSPLWSNQAQRSAEAGRQFSLALFDGVLYLVGVVNPGSSTLSAFQSQDGKQLWAWQTPFVLSPFAPPNHIYGSSLNKGESFCALRESDGGKAWCAGYNQAGPALFAEAKLYLYAFAITAEGASFSEQPAQIYVLDENDGSLVAHYAPADVTRTQLMGMVLS